MSGTPGGWVQAAIEAIVLFLFVVGGASFLALLKGCFVLRRYFRANSKDYGIVLLKSPLVPAVSVIAAPPDDSPASREYVRLLLDLNYSRHEVVVALDGPPESEMETWIREFRLVPSSRPVGDKLYTARLRGVYESRDPISLVVVSKERGGTADSLNAAVNVAALPVIGLIDPESEFPATILQRIVRPMLEGQETIAVCGVTAGPQAAGFAGLVGGIESLRTWLGRAAAYAGWDMALPVPGASLVALRDAVVQAGGFTDGALELVLGLHGIAAAAGKRNSIGFVSGPVSHTRAPKSWADLRRHAVRDQQELVRAGRKRKASAGSLRWRGLPGLYLVRVARPLLETLAYLLTIVALAMGWIGLPLALLVLLATVGMGMTVSMATVVLRQIAEFQVADPQTVAAMFFAAVPENLGYRQVRNLWLIGAIGKRPRREKQNRGRTVRDRPPAVSQTSTNRD